MDEVVGEFVSHGEAQAIEVPLRSAPHERILLSIQIDAGKVRRDRGLNAILGSEVVELDWFESKIDFKEREDLHFLFVLCQCRRLPIGARDCIGHSVEKTLFAHYLARIAKES